MPLRFVPPLVPTLAEKAPVGDGWLHEIKFDGYRTQIIVDAGVVRLFTRNAHDWTERYRPLAECAATLSCSSAIIDGEVIVQDQHGRSDFHALRSAIDHRPDDLVFMAFDFLHLDGHDLRGRPIEERRELLAGLIGPPDPGRPIHFSEHVVGGGPEFLAAADALGLEGIVSKKLGSRYRSGPSRSWLKVKTFEEQELIVIGTAKGDRAPVALLARETDGGLAYAGGAMVTLPEPERDRFWEAAERLRRPDPPIPMPRRKETGWHEPRMKVKVRTLRGEEPLRHATVTAIVSTGDQAPRPLPKSRGEREPRYTKPPLDHVAIAAYYGLIAPVMLPFVADRPLNLFRCTSKTCFFQRNANHPATEPGTFGPPIGRMPILQKNGRTEEYLFVSEASGVSACVAAEAVEFHGWGSLVADVERPDRLVIDLDPGEGVTFHGVKSAAFELRQVLATRWKLRSFALLTGGKGLHVVVPLRPEADWQVVREFARGVWEALAMAEPERFTIALPKAERGGRIFLDYLRNQRTATAVLPYSVRARESLPVAAPVSWREFPKVRSAGAFTVADVRRLIRRASSASLRGWGVADQALS